jgi:hypothetical protein
LCVIRGFAPGSRAYRVVPGDGGGRKVPGGGSRTLLCVHVISARGYQVWSKRDGRGKREGAGKEVGGKSGGNIDWQTERHRPGKHIEERHDKGLHNIHDLRVVVDDLHLEIQAHELAQMAGRVGVLSTEDRPDFIDSARHSCNL